MAPFFSVFLVGIPLALARSFFPSVGDAIWESSLFSVFWLLLWLCAIIGFIASFFAEFPVRAARCPRCGNYFHARVSQRWGAVSWTYARKCLNCGLALNGVGLHVHA